MSEIHITSHEQTKSIDKIKKSVFYACKWVFEFVYWHWPRLLVCYIVIWCSLHTTLLFLKNQKALALWIKMSSTQSEESKNDDAKEEPSATSTAPYGDSKKNYSVRNILIIILNVIENIWKVASVC